MADDDDDDDDDARLLLASSACFADGKKHSRFLLDSTLFLSLSIRSQITPSTARPRPDNTELNEVR